MKIERFKIFDMFWFLGLLLAATFSYKNFVCVYYSGIGFDFEFDMLRFISGSILILIALFFNSLQRDIYYLIGSLFTILMVIPNVIMYQYKPEVTFLMAFYPVLLVVLLSLSSFVNIEFDRLFKITSYKMATISVLIIAILIPIALSYKLNVNFRTLLLEDIYQVRQEGVKQLNSITHYLYQWLVKILMPVGLVLALKYRQRALFVIFLLIQIYLFMVQGHKTVFISVFLTAFYFIKDFKAQTRLLIVGSFFMVFLSHLATYATGNLFIESVLVRRVLFVPAINNLFYFEFFDEQHLYYSYSFLKSFIDYPFAIEPQYLMGQLYYGEPEMSVNNGWMSDGMMNIGHLGIVFNIFVAVVYFKLLTKAQLSPIFSGLLVLIVFTLISSYLFTAMLTHGLFLFVVLAYLVLRYPKQITTK